MEKRIFEMKKKVYLFDTDATDIVYYARHLEWLEMTRIEFVTFIYKPLTRMISEDQISFVPINVNINYKAPARFEDVLTIKLWVKDTDKLRLNLAYQVVKEDAGKEVVVSEAEISLLCVNVAKGSKPCKIPDFMKQAIENWENGKQRIEIS